MDERLKDKRTKQLEKAIRSGLEGIRGKIRLGDESELVLWVIDDELACSQRPLRDHPKFGGSAKSLPCEAKPFVISWVDRIRQMGICSIICLMHSKELKYYDELELDADGLLGFYSKQGFQVCHLPWPDPAHESQLPQERIEEKIKRDALAAFH